MEPLLTASKRHAAFSAATRDPVVRMLCRRLIHKCDGDKKRAFFLTLQLEAAMCSALHEHGLPASHARDLGHEYSREMAAARKMLRAVDLSEHE